MIEIVIKIINPINRNYDRHEDDERCLRNINLELSNFDDHLDPNVTLMDNEAKSLLQVV